MTTTVAAVDPEPQQRIQLTTCPNSDRRLLVFDAFTGSRHQLVNDPAEHFLAIKPSGVHVFANFSPCCF